MAGTISSKNVTKRNRNGRTPTINRVGSVSAVSSTSASGGGSSTSLLDLANTWAQKQIFSSDIDVLGILSPAKVSALNSIDPFLDLGIDALANGDGGLRIYGASSALLSTLKYTNASGWWDLDKPFMVNMTALGATPVFDNGLSLKNSTPATVGGQQVSPAIRWSGNGWKTTATAGSQPVDFVSYVLPVQGTTNPSATLVFASSINNGAITNRMTLTSSGALGVTSLALGGALTGVTTIANSNTHTLTRTGLATTSTDGFIITNTTAATVGAQVQVSPRIRLSGTVWDTASRTSNWIIENVPSGGVPATGKISFKYDLAGGGYSEKFSFGNTGTFISTRNAFGTTGSYVDAFPTSNYLQLVSGGNEILIGSTATTLNINYRAGSATTPTSYIWNAGTSTSYADHTLGSLVAQTNAKSPSFLTGWIGNGWKINTSDASMELDELTIRGTMRVYELLIQQIRATNGSVFVSASAKIKQFVGLAGYESVTFEDPSNHGICPFSTHDIVLIQRLRLDSSTVIKRIVRRVVSTSGATAELEPLGGSAPADTGAIEFGDEVVRIGNTTYADRQGLVYLTADDTNAPYLDIVSGVTSWASWTGNTKIKARLGRLDGITDADAGLSGSQTNYYGLYSNNVHLKGTIYTQDGNIGGLEISSAGLYKDGITYDVYVGTLPSGISSYGEGFAIYKDANNYTTLYTDTYNGKNYLKSVLNGNVLFTLGDTNKIAAFSFDNTKMFSANVQIDDNGLKFLNPSGSTTTKSIDFYSASTTKYASIEYDTSGYGMGIYGKVTGANFGISFNGATSIVGLTDALVYTEGDLELTGERVAIKCSQVGSGWLKLINVPTSASGLTTGMVYTQTVAQVIGSGADPRKVLMIA